jgi:hypothetical protein
MLERRSESARMHHQRKNVTTNLIAFEHPADPKFVFLLFFTEHLADDYSAKDNLHALGKLNFITLRLKIFN